MNRDDLDEKVTNAFSGEFSDAFLRLNDDEVDKLYNYMKQYKHQQMKNKK